MRLNCISSCCCSYFHLSHIDGIGVFCTGSQVSNLASRFDNLFFLFRFTCSFIYDRLSVLVENIIFHFTVCTAYRNGSIGGYPSRIILVGVVMLLALCVITCFSSFSRGDGIRAEGYTTILSDICIRGGIPVAICYSRIIRGPADAWRASPRQGTGGEGQGDDAGQGWGAVVDGWLATLVISLCEF